MKFRYVVLLVLVLLAFYMIIGTIERRTDYTPASTIQDYDYTEEIEAVKARQAEIKAMLEEFDKELEELLYDESIPLEYELQLHLKAECERYGVDVSEAIAIMLTENPTLNPKLVHRNTNGTSDTGLFQINSCNKKEFLNMGFNDLTDPKQNISYGIYFLSTLDKYEGHEKYMAYNMGEGGMKQAVSRGISSTQYSRKVMSKLKEQNN